MLHLDIDRKKNVTLTHQIYDGIKAKILSGELAADSRLPSSRDLSRFLSVSRNVVLEAYEQLTAEGFTYTAHGSGTYVLNGTQLKDYQTAPALTRKPLTGLRHEPDSDLIDFRTGVPDLSLFPIKKWGKTYKEICDTLDSSTLDYYEPRGCYELRYALAGYLLKTRGVTCDAEQIFITTGAAQGFALTARVLLSPADHVVTEDPVNSDILKTLRASGAKIHTIPVDEQGLQTDMLPQHIPIKYIFTTPSHHFPTGGILSAQRRVALIQYAEKSGGYIIEDDYDSEYRFSGAPIHSLQSLSPERVIYVGTFSKKLFPALRIGFMVLPKHLTNAFLNAKHLEDLHSPALEQLTLARFITDGLVERHINKSRRIYKEKRTWLENALKTTFGDDVVIKGNATGIHLIAIFKNTVFDSHAYKLFEKSGVRLYPIDTHAVVKGRYNDTLMIGYGNLTKVQIETGVKRIESVIRTLKKPGG